MKRTSVKQALLTIASLIFLANGTLAQTSPARAMLTKLGSLAGDWQGTLEWTGARSDRGTLEAHYYVTGNGSAVVEDLIMDGKPTMTSVYHLDGNDLRMTHYCGAGNQPRLKATRIDSDKGSVDFDFVDATNLASPAAPHVHGMELQMAGPDQITIHFLFTAGGKESEESIVLKRKARPTSHRSEKKLLRRRPAF